MLNLQMLKDLVARNITDALQSVITTHARLRKTKVDKLVAKASTGLTASLSCSRIEDSSQTPHGENKIKILSQNLSSDLQMTQVLSTREIGDEHRRSTSDKVALQIENKEISSEGTKKAITDTEVEYTLIIDGHSLAFILAESDLQELFIQVCLKCASVLCCRVSPQQKAQVTKLVRKGLGQNRLCLAIGDGANDVGMIQAANVGVGITGVEGAQVRLL